jgi:hypothetical protein
MAVKRTALGKRKRTPAVSMPSAKLQAQVKRLMRMRQEKKFAEISVTGLVAQVDVIVPGALVSDITPTISQGDGEGQRIGNSITGTGLVFKQQFIKQAAAIGPRRLRTHIVRSLEPNISATAVLNSVLDINPLSGVRDYFSALNYTMMSDKRLQLLGTKETKLLSNYDDNMIQINERATGDLTVPVKFDDQTIRYAGDLSPLPASVRYFAITLCDNGNLNATVSTLPVFITTGLSGVESKAYARLWYTDS